MSVADPDSAAQADEVPSGRDDLGEVATTVRLRTRVLPGGRIDVISPHLPDGEAVELDIRLEHPAQDTVTASAKPAHSGGKFDLLAWLDSLPASSRTPEEWEEFEREFQQERDSWGR